MIADGVQSVPRGMRCVAAPAPAGAAGLGWLAGKPQPLPSSQTHTGPALGQYRRYRSGPALHLRLRGALHALPGGTPLLVVEGGLVQQRLDLVNVRVGPDQQHCAQEKGGGEKREGCGWVRWVLPHAPAPLLGPSLPGPHTPRTHPLACQRR